MSPKVNKRTLTLGAIAFLLVAATVYDYTAGSGSKRETRTGPSIGAGAKQSPPSGTSLKQEPAPVPSPSSAAPPRPQTKPETPRSRIANLVRESTELKYFLAHAPEIRGRYQAIAVPYAEAVATFATLYSSGDSPQAVAKRLLVGLVPAGVDVNGLLISEAAPTDKGAVWLTATLSLTGKDSVAFEKAVLALGDPAHGTLWKELEIASDPDTRTLKASGKLLVLMVEQSE